MTDKSRGFLYAWVQEFEYGKYKRRAHKIGPLLAIPNLISFFSNLKTEKKEKAKTKLPTETSLLSW